ncbi:MAG: tRNA pseudouridine(38-40) synthase TruA [Lentisphaeria bacterium]|nr:tRNA pseudouridine(38-40) synthase TruA [Lentisphaeria bacterium]NQZ67695.1 tRNA pseudouridine(38-40) synthase TruA [Lentisphaeria bacterium]
MDAAEPSSSRTSRYLLLQLAYDGTNYCGWQIQENSVTVQETLKTALSEIYSEIHYMTGCSRTDSGVHALAQFVTLHVPESPPIPLQRLKRAINTYLPIDVRVVSIEEKSSKFNSRFDNQGKAYTYLIHQDQSNSVFLHRYCWHTHYKLNLAEIEKAAAQLSGTHDFNEFAISADHRENTVRTLHDFQLKSYGHILAITVKGDAFLYKMVRRLAGFLHDVGADKFAAEDTEKLLNSEMAFNIKTAPAQGLFLEHVCFDNALESYESTELPFMSFLKTT